MFLTRLFTFVGGAVGWWFLYPLVFFEGRTRDYFYDQADRLWDWGIFSLLLAVSAVVGWVIGYLLAAFIGMFLPQDAVEGTYPLVRTGESEYTYLQPIPIVVSTGSSTTTAMTFIPQRREEIHFIFRNSQGQEVQRTVSKSSTITYREDRDDSVVVIRNWDFVHDWAKSWFYPKDTEYEFYLPF